MGQGTVGVTRQNTRIHYQNIVLHPNEMHTETENAGLQENTSAPQNVHNDPNNDPIIKIQNTTDAKEEDGN